MYENSLMYSNQSYILTVKCDEIAVYLQNFILGQLVVALILLKTLMTTFALEMRPN